MKKLLLAVAVVAFLASCKKDYTCTCTDTSGILPLLPNTTQAYPNLTKSDADAAKTVCTATNVSSYYTCTWAED